MVQLVVVHEGMEAILAAIPDVPHEGAVMEQGTVLVTELIAEPLIEGLGFATLGAGS